ncbi:MAG TPA: hypothetical protein VFH27_05530, partial [Longimicrobiaceae bacterium]|nr:hypothetical protein [Longimicrobiaceae bacterium]
MQKRTIQLTALIEREESGYVSLCPEMDIASQGDTIEEARTNLVEALELFFETADDSEVERRLHGEIVERGSHAELMAHGGRYRELHDRQYAWERERFVNPGEELPMEAG